MDACPVDCIHPRKNEPSLAASRQLYNNLIECISCGACVPVCSVSAIFALDDFPEKWKKHAVINAAEESESQNVVVVCLYRSACSEDVLFLKSLTL